MTEQPCGQPTSAIHLFRNVSPQGPLSHTNKQRMIAKGSQTVPGRHTNNRNRSDKSAGKPLIRDLRNTLRLLENFLLLVNLT
jgi:hypothetical protein